MPTLRARSCTWTPPHDFVIVKCCLFLGADYNLSGKKTEALKQGRLSALDRVETAAKARCARDFGISTEFALELGEDGLETEGIEEVEVAVFATSPTHAHAQSNGKEPLPVSLDTVRALVWSAYRVPADQQTPVTWEKYKVSVLGADVPDALFSAAERARLHEHALGLHTRQQKSTRQHVVRALDPHIIIILREPFAHATRRKRNLYGPTIAPNDRHHRPGELYPGHLRGSDAHPSP